MTDESLGKQALKAKVVLQTWKGALKGEGQLLRNWIKTGGVLVGIGPRPHQEKGQAKSSRTVPSPTLCA